MIVEATATKCGVVVVAAAPFIARPCGDATIDVAGIGIGQQT
jgi:hypothetical protein